jgi:26S proteasome regulatory subunit N1
MARSEAQPPETTDDLLDLVHVIVPFHIRQHSEHEAIDLLLEVDHLGEILNFVDAASAPRICRYLLSCADFLPEGEEAEVLKVAERVCRKAEMWPDAFRSAARTGDPEAVQQVFNDAPDGVVKKQLALMAGSLQLNIVTDDEELQALCGNSRLSSWYLQLAKDLNVSEAKHPDEIVKSGDTRLAGGMEDAKKNLSTSLISALTNAGHCNDKVLCATVAEGAAGAEPGSGAKWYAPNFPRFVDFLPPFICYAVPLASPTHCMCRFYKHKDDSQFSAVAALGLVHLWNIEEGPNVIDVLSYATENEISAGCLLATGIICCNCRSETDPALAILRDHLDLSTPDTPPLKRIAAAMGLGLSYCGTAREDVSEILSAIVADSEVGTELFSLAALSLGAVFVGTGNNSVAETICNALICERSDVQLRNTMTRFACLGLGLVFLGRQDCCEAILEACRAMPEVCRDYATMTVRFSSLSSHTSFSLYTRTSFNPCSSSGSHLRVCRHWKCCSHSRADARMCRAPRCHFREERSKCRLCWRCCQRPPRC